MGWIRDRVTFKVVTMASAVASGLLARKALDLAWRRVSGHAPPKRPGSPRVSMSEAALWTAAAGIAVGVAKLVGERAAAELLRKRRRGDLSLPSLRG